MKETIVTKTITEKRLELDQDDIERIIKDYFCDDSDVEWDFNFGFDIHGYVAARIRRTITEVKE